MSKRNFLFSAALPFMAFGLATTASAQQAPTTDQVVTTPVADVVEDDAKTEDEEIVVTGSRLRRDGFDSTLPLTVITADTIRDRQFTNVITALEELPIFGAGVNARGANGQFGDNFAFPDALDCGTQRTLTLINGRRAVSGNQGTVFVPDNATGAQVDYTSINPLVIASVETVTGTGGSVYGADAVCGVVNLITQTDFEGVRYTLQGGLTQYGDGGNYRAAGLWGKNFFGDRLNVTLGLDYSHQDIVRNGGGRPFDRAQGFLVNPANGAQRNTAAFNPAAAVASLLLSPTATLAPAFLPANADNQVTNFFTNGPVRNPLFAQGGVFVTGPQSIGGATPGGGATPVFPNTPIAGALAAAGASAAVPFTFFAPSSLPAGVTPAAVIASLAPGVSITGLTAAQQTALAVNLLQRNRPTPFEFAQQNPGIDPLLFIARFQPTGLYPTIANTNTATNTLFPRLAVPLRFDENGNLTRFNVGTLTTGTANSPNFPTIGAVIGGDGFNGEELRTGNLLSGSDRGAFNLFTTLKLTNNIRYKTETQWAELRFRSNAGLQANGAVGASVAAGSSAIPIFINQNPFVTPSTLSTLTTLQGQGLVLPVINTGTAAAPVNNPVIYVNRIFDDLTNFQNFKSGNEVRNIRTVHSLQGDFNLLNRNFFWDTSFVYGRNRIVNYSPQILDVEFALAVDAVRRADGQIVCRQQTLAAPEAINIRNPFLANININTPGRLVPTQAQIDACVPFNVFGPNSTTDAVRDYVLDQGDSRNLGQQFYAAGTLGGDVIKLPGGTATFVTNFEWRRESLVFTPGQSFATGSARNTTGQPSDGVVRFFEGGFEGLLPIFGDEFTLPLFKKLFFEGSVRVVSRDQSTQNPTFAAFFNQPGTLNTTYTAGGQWSPFDDISFRGNRSRSVRSASIVELFGSVGTGFSNGTGSVCTTETIGQGPAPAVRRANCIQAVVSTGVAANSAAAEAFLSTFNNASVFNGQPASTGGTPGLQNEIADNWSVGTTIRPRFIPNLTLAGDFYSVNIAGEITLAGPGVSLPTCFDTSNFASGQFSSFCDSLVFGVRNSAGVNVIPATNPITGAPLPPAAVAGQPATRTEDFQFAFVFFPNANLARREIRSVNGVVQYNFALSDILGARAAPLGRVNLTGNAYWTLRYDVLADGSEQSRNPAAGEISSLETRLTINHRAGKFGQYLQWFRNSGTVGNVQTNPNDFDEQSILFRFPSDNTFNYGASYDWNDHLTIGFVANNVTRASQFPQFAVVNDTLGRTFSFSINGRF